MTRWITRREFLRTAALLAATPFLKACGDGEPTQPNPQVSVSTSVNTPKAFATGTPIPRIEATPFPKMNKTVPSPYVAAGLYIGTYGQTADGKPLTEGAISAKNFNEAGHQQNGYSNITFGNGESRSVTLYLDEDGKREIPAATMVSQEWLDSSFQAKTIGARTTGTLPNGKQAEKESTSWYLLDDKGKRTGETFVTVVPNRQKANFGWPLLAMKGNELYVSVADAKGNLLPGEDFRPAFQKPKDIAQKQAQYTGDTSKLVGLSLDYDGKIRLRDIQNKVIETVKYIGDADVAFGKWVGESIKATEFDSKLQAAQKEYATLTGKDTTSLTLDSEIKFDRDGKPYALIVDKGIDGDTPLIITDMAKGEWRAPGFREVAPVTFNVGSELNSWTAPNLINKTYVETFMNNYDIGTPAGIIDEGFYGKIPKNKKLTPDEIVQAYDWGQFNIVTKFLAERNIKTIIMHMFPGGIFTHANAPRWMRDMTDQDLNTWIVKHIETIASHLVEKGVDPKAVSVINELAWHAKDKNAYDQVWLEGDYLYSRLSDGYIKKAFETARKMWPKATLLLNDDNATEGEQTNTPFNAEAQVELALIKRMRDAGVPIDGFGEQAHLLARNFITGSGTIEQNIETNITGYKKQLAMLMKGYNELGAKFYITELDVNIGGLPANWSQLQKEALKARLFASVFETALNSKNCDTVTTWGFTNASSWIFQGGGYPYGPGESPLPFDDKYKPTQSVYAIRKILYSYQGK